MIACLYVSNWNDSSLLLTPCFRFICSAAAKKFLLSGVSGIEKWWKVLLAKAGKNENKIILLFFISFFHSVHRNEAKFHLTNKFVFNPITNYRFVSVAFNCVFAYDDLVEKIFTDQLDSLAAYFVSFSSAFFSLLLHLLHGSVRFACTDCFNVKFIASCRSLRPLCAPVRSFRWAKPMFSSIFRNYALLSSPTRSFLFYVLDVVSCSAAILSGAKFDSAADCISLMN